MPARAKLPPGQGKRVPLNMRTTQEVRDRLERDAADSGRSLVQEVEAHLERSFQEEDALGGRQLRSMFGLLANAAVLIQEQTGKSCFEDWDTWIAVNEAWKRLIWAFAPPWPQEWNDALMEATAVPVPEVPPPLPPLPSMLSFEGDHQYQDELKKNEAAWKQYEKEYAKHEKAGEALRLYTEKIKAQMDWGREIGKSLLPDKRTKEG